MPHSSWKIDLGLAARVDEDQRRLVPLDQLVDFAERVARRMPGPGQPLGGVEHGDVGRGAGFGDHEIGQRARRRAAAAPDSGADRPARRRSPTGRRVVSCGASANSRASPSDSRSPRFDVTSECSSSSTTRLSEPNRNGASARGEQQRELLRRGQQDVGRIAALALALRGRRVAGAGLDPDRQPHLGDRRLEIARDVDRERLQRRDVERVQPAARGARRGRWRSAFFALRERLAPSRSTPPGSAGIPASVLPAPVGAISSTERPARASRSNSS